MFLKYILQTFVMHSRSGAEWGGHNNRHLLTYKQVEYRPNLTQTNTKCMGYWVLCHIRRNRT